MSGSQGKQTSTLWYAVYGSNLYKKRFMHYLQMCKPPIEDEHDIQDEPYLVPYKLYFATDKTNTWGNGGVAFVDDMRVDEEDGKTLGRKYLLTIPQLKFVALQENGLTQERYIEESKISQVIPSGNQADIRRGDIKVGKYGLLVRCDTLAGIPVVTLTTSWP